MTRAMRQRRTPPVVTRLLAGLLLAPALLLAACSDNKTNKGPGFGSSITGTATGGDFKLSVSLNPNNIELGQRAGITVLATTKNGVPLAGRPVQLSTTAGVLSKVAGETDPAGKFVAFIKVDALESGGTPSGNIPANQVVITAIVDGLSASGILFIGAPGDLTIVPGSATLAPGAQQVFNCIGGVAPYRWEPSGGTLNTAAGPSVTYTAGTQFGTFTLKCTDSAGKAVGAQITISNAALQEPVISPTTATLRPGQTQTFTVSGGTAPFSWNASGGTLNTNTGTTVIFTAGSVKGTFEVRVTDAAGKQASAAVTIDIPADLAFTGAATLTFKAVGASPGTCSVTSFTKVLTASGGLLPYNFIAQSGTSRLSTTVGFTSPTNVTYTFPSTTLVGGSSESDQVTVIDATGTQKSVTITVNCTAS